MGYVRGRMEWEGGRGGEKAKLDMQVGNKSDIKLIGWRQVVKGSKRY